MAGAYPEGKGNFLVTDTDKRLKNLTRKGRGRPKGAVNKTTQAIATLARELTFENPEYVRRLRERLAAGKAPHMETLLAYYGYGKPADKLRLEDNRKPTLLNIGLVPQLPPGERGH